MDEAKVAKGAAIIVEATKNSMPELNIAERIAALKGAVGILEGTLQGEVHMEWIKNLLKQQGK